MDLLVRPAASRATPACRCCSSRRGPTTRPTPGPSKRALALLEAVFAEPGHAASYDCCTVALAGDELVGVVAGFPVAAGRPALAALRPAHAAQAPAVALAGDVPAPARRRARRSQPARRRLLRRRARRRRRLAAARDRAPAARRGARRGASAPGCTGSRSTPACRTTPRARLYEAYGFGEREIRRAARRADGARARRARVRRLPDGGVEDALERLGDLRDLRLRDLGEERQRDRARGDVLADRELALAVAEASRGSSDIRWIAGR